MKDGEKQRGVYVESKWIKKEELKTKRAADTLLRTKFPRVKVTSDVGREEGTQAPSPGQKLQTWKCVRRSTFPEGL